MDKGRVLVVDDDPSWSAFALEGLRLAGFQAAGQSDLLPTGGFEAWVLDVPADSPEEWSALDDRPADVPLVVTCGSSDPRALEFAARVALRSRAVEFLVKPYSLEVLADVLEQAVARRRDAAEDARVCNPAKCVVLLASQDRWSRAVHERRALSAQLQHAERLATVGQLASGVAHQLGTPLNVIMGRAKLIRTAVERATPARIGAGASDSGRLPASIDDNARIIHELSQHMASTVRGLLGLARKPSERVPADLLELTERSLRLVDSVFTERRVRVKRLPMAGPFPVHVDPLAMQQVLTNLLVNAAQATPAGGEVWVEVREATAAETTGHPPGRVLRVAIRDSGPGIPPESLERLFEPFFTTKPVGEGTGLGLPVAQAIVTEHAGWIVASNPKGGGACFTVFLPGGQE
ncbi:MAG: hypothetical protein KDD82_25155 [Planctomycetes bacterium]|nr:hypothetical protein [Planctomycetota bacterium]